MPCSCLWVLLGIDTGSPSYTHLKCGLWCVQSACCGSQASNSAAHVRICFSSLYAIYSNFQPNLLNGISIYLGGKQLKMNKFPCDDAAVPVYPIRECQLLKVLDLPSAMAQVHVDLCWRIRPGKDKVFASIRLKYYNATLLGPSHFQLFTIHPASVPFGE